MRILNSALRFIAVSGALAGAGGAWADGNTVYLSQMGEGNVITVDQSAASNSVVRGAQGPDGSAPAGGAAAQIGTGNRASIEVTGTGSDVRFFQRNPPRGEGNVAEVAVGVLAGALSQPLSGPASVSLFQDGDGNHSSISVTGLSSEGAVTQIGMDNKASLTVIGQRSSGALLQEGNNNALDVEVTGSGVAVAYEQIGDKLGTPSSVPAQVFSTARQVLIRQTVLGGS